MYQEECENLYTPIFPSSFSIDIEAWINFNPCEVDLLSTDISQQGDYTGYIKFLESVLKSEIEDHAFYRIIYELCPRDTLSKYGRPLEFLGLCKSATWGNTDQSE